MLKMSLKDGVCRGCYRTRRGESKIERLDKLLLSDLSGCFLTARLAKRMGD